MLLLIFAGAVGFACGFLAMVATADLLLGLMIWLLVWFAYYRWMRAKGAAAARAELRAARARHGPWAPLPEVPPRRSWFFFWWG